MANSVKRVWLLLLFGALLAISSGQSYAQTASDFFITVWDMPAGDLELTFPGEGSYTIDWGGSGQLKELQSGAALRLKGEVSHTQMNVERATGVSVAQSVQVQQVRVALERSSTHKLASGASMQPSVEAGVRYDGAMARPVPGLSWALAYNIPTRLAA